MPTLGEAHRFIGRTGNPLVQRLGGGGGVGEIRGKHMGHVKCVLGIYVIWIEPPFVPQKIM